MATSFFVSDLHGSLERCATLFRLIRAERPAAVFLGGYLLPSGFGGLGGSALDGFDVVDDVLVRGFETLRAALEGDYPRVFVILGNDDPRSEEAGMLDAEASGLWDYVHQRRVDWGDLQVYGYACVPGPRP